MSSEDKKESNQPEKDKNSDGSKDSAETKEDKALNEEASQEAGSSDAPENAEENKNLNFKNKAAQKKEKESIKVLAVFYLKYLLLCLLILLLIRPFLFYPLDIFENFRYIGFNFKTANYHAAQKHLAFIDNISLITKKTSAGSYKARNKLFDRYLKIKESSDINFYNAAGLFSSIDDDFAVLYQLNENKAGENELYTAYKKRYLAELKSLLKNYKKRNRKIRNFVNTKNTSRYKIPERLELYEKLADSYLKYEKFPINDKTLEEFRNIADTYDNIYQQEKGFQREKTSLSFVISEKSDDEEENQQQEQSSPDMYGGGGFGSDGFGGGMYGEYSKPRETYPTFIYSYKTAYIITEGVVYMSRMCDNADVIKQYIAPLTVRDILPDSQIEKITAMCRESHKQTEDEQ